MPPLQVGVEFEYRMIALHRKCQSVLVYARWSCGRLRDNTALPF